MNARPEQPIDRSSATIKTRVDWGTQPVSANADN